MQQKEKKKQLSNWTNAAQNLITSWQFERLINNMVPAIYNFLRGCIGCQEAASGGGEIRSKHLYR